MSPHRRALLFFALVTACERPSPTGPASGGDQTAPETNPAFDVATSEPGSPLPFLTLARSEEHTSELQSQSNLVCRLLLEKKNRIEHDVLSRLLRVCDRMARFVRSRALTGRFFTARPDRWPTRIPVASLRLTAHRRRVPDT